MRISDWSSDVCSSDLSAPLIQPPSVTMRRCSSGNTVFTPPMATSDSSTSCTSRPKSGSSSVIAVVPRPEQGNRNQNEKHPDQRQAQRADGEEDHQIGRAHV